MALAADNWELRMDASGQYWWCHDALQMFMNINAFVWPGRAYNERPDVDEEASHLHQQWGLEVHFPDEDNAEWLRIWTLWRSHDLYTMLGVSPDPWNHGAGFDAIGLKAREQEVKDGFKRKLLGSHSDKTGNHGAGFDADALKTVRDALLDKLFPGSRNLYLFVWKALHQSAPGSLATPQDGASTGTAPRQQAGSEDGVVSVAHPVVEACLTPRRVSILAKDYVSKKPSMSDAADAGSTADGAEWPQPEKAPKQKSLWADMVSDDEDELVNKRADEFPSGMQPAIDKQSDPQLVPPTAAPAHKISASVVVPSLSKPSALEVQTRAALELEQRCEEPSFLQPAVMSRSAAVVNYRCCLTDKAKNGKPKAVNYRKAPDQEGELRHGDQENEQKDRPRFGDIVQALEIEGDWMRTEKGWLPIKKDKKGRGELVLFELVQDGEQHQ